jgi:hypothetical protein
MKSQKQAVVDEVKAALPGFIPGKDIAIVDLSEQDLEDIKKSVTDGIANGSIEYSKDRTNNAEVRTYARSMVMNHLKKAKELNGGAVLQRSSVSEGSPTKTVRVNVKSAPKGVEVSLLPEYIKDLAKSLA